jgi:hypothetical protein
MLISCRHSSSSFCGIVTSSIFPRMGFYDILICRNLRGVSYYWVSSYYHPRMNIYWTLISGNSLCRVFPCVRHAVLQDSVIENLLFFICREMYSLQNRQLFAPVSDKTRNGFCGIWTLWWSRKI